MKLGVVLLSFNNITLSGVSDTGRISQFNRIKDNVYQFILPIHFIEQILLFTGYLGVKTVSVVWKPDVIYSIPHFGMWEKWENFMSTSKMSANDVAESKL